MACSWWHEEVVMPGHAAGAGLTLTDHTFTVPLDHMGATPGELELFAREVVAHGRAKLQLPYLLFLQGMVSHTSRPSLHSTGHCKCLHGGWRIRFQLGLLCWAGGPGFESPRPTEASAWLKSAVAHFRVVLMDQRGTGRSGAVTCASLQRVGDSQAQAAFLAHFR